MSGQELNKPTRSFDELVKSPLHPKWSEWRAPDTSSMIEAVRVQMLLAAGAGGSPADYLVEHDGYTREEAEAIVANCATRDDEP